MRVLKHGADPTKRWFRSTCFRCKAEFEYQQFEGKVTSDQREGDAVTIDCPECGYTCWTSLRTGEFRPARPSR